MKQEAKLAKKTGKVWIEGSEGNQETSVFRKPRQERISAVGDAAEEGSKMKDKWWQRAG